MSMAAPAATVAGAGDAAASLGETPTWSETSAALTEGESAKVGRISVVDTLWTLNAGFPCDACCLGRWFCIGRVVPAEKEKQRLDLERIMAASKHHRQVDISVKREHRTKCSLQKFKSSQSGS